MFYRARLCLMLEIKDKHEAFPKGQVNKYIEGVLLKESSDFVFV